ncbi:MAG: TetR/AcrR family transcriptional regulator [Planctomycetota bacterium]
MKEKLLDAAEELVQARGLNGVTFQDLADAVGLRKPSVFHHIRNKEELASALIERCGTKHGPQYAAVVEAEAGAAEKLRRIAGIFEKGLKGGRPCLLAAIGSGLDSLSPSGVQQLKGAADASVTRFAEVFTQGRRDGTLSFEGSPTHAAMGFFAMLQGLQTLCRAKGDTKAFKKAASSYIDSITVQSR